MALAFNAAPAGHIVDANALHIWRLDEVSDSSNAVDIISGFNLIQYNTPNIVAGKIDNARSFDGTSGGGIFQTPNDSAFNSALNANWTLEMWVKQDTGAATSALFISCGINWASTAADLFLVNLGILDTGRLFVNTYSAVGVAEQGLSATPYLVANTWNHIALTRTLLGGGNIYYEIFVNGKYNTSFTHTGYVVPITGTSHYIQLGNLISGGAGTGTAVFDGAIDDTRFSNIVRTPLEILESYERGWGNPATQGSKHRAGSHSDVRNGSNQLLKPGAQ